MIVTARGTAIEHIEQSGTVLLEDGSETVAKWPFPDDPIEAGKNVSMLHIPIDGWVITQAEL